MRFWVALGCAYGVSQASWLEVHMDLEHQLTVYDTRSAFRLHVQDASGRWSKADVLSMYGLNGNEDVQESDKDHVWDTVYHMYDTNGDGFIGEEEFVTGVDKGKELPDFGFGQGHHGDMEHEYEIHHFRQFHSPDDPEEAFNHPEDIQHEKDHHEMFHKHESPHLAPYKNIPPKFRHY